ncbi:reductive dehalogenase [Dehalococcoides mccartyi]|uniref:Reductive dehalogenase n=1 Tax=Dehalococcoides mccartyi (strain CBDB1) TaxID=255470 RepID=A0A916KN63_DEHMC|nr:reductive dehalogenase [Dehalococcoides mccartyi]CAI83513.1 putative reductive dehalogenase [Dehalococcoides mccartyi CBDB1]
MRGFHSSVSRREFMKVLGLGTAGLGAIAASAPVFNDLDEIVSSGGKWKRPWWVKEVDNPTMEVDWSLINGSAPNENSEGLHHWQVMAKYLGQDEALRLLAQGQEDKINGILANRPGCTLRDCALNTGGGKHGEITWEGPQTLTPEQMGVPRWEGTPEENSRMLRSAMRHYGAGEFGVVEVDQNIKKLLYLKDGSRLFITPQGVQGYDRPFHYEFKDIDEGYVDDANSAFVLPNKAKYLVTYTVEMPRELFRTSQSDLSNQGSSSRYRRQQEVINCTQGFLRSIGYRGYGTGPFPNGICPSPASATLSGLGEMDRKNQCTLPDLGVNVGLFKFFTDLPLVVTKPIDAGIFRFCHTCKKCAETCPSQSIMYEDEPTWETPGNWATTGHKAFFKHEVSCQTLRNSSGVACQTCMGVCVFNVNTAASVHEFVKTTIATTSIFNGFLWQADKFFGYGLHDAEEWWDLDLPIYGIDSTRGAYDGGYAK